VAHVSIISIFIKGVKSLILPALHQTAPVAQWIEHLTALSSIDATYRAIPAPQLFD